MITPNTISREEYAQRLYEACTRISKRLSNIAFEEQDKRLTAENKGNNEKALRLYFNERALNLAKYALTKSPEDLMNIR